MEQDDGEEDEDDGRLGEHDEEEIGVEEIAHIPSVELGSEGGGGGSRMMMR